MNLSEFPPSSSTHQPTQKGKHFKWTKEENKAFEQLKLRLTQAPTLACLDSCEKFFLQTDASNQRLGVVLTQTIEGQERVIAYASQHLNKAKMNYSLTEKYFLAILRGMKKMKTYLECYCLMLWPILTPSRVLKKE